MKRSLPFLLTYLPWLLLLLGMDGFCALLLWLADADAFLSLSAVVLLGSLFLFSTLCFVLVRLQRRREQAFSDFLDSPDEYHEERLRKAADPASREAVRRLGEELRRRQNAFLELREQLDDYEEYVESWAHETKTPLSLLTLLLDNRREELSAPLCFKLDYIRNHIRQSVDQMLFFARLKGARKDYLFEAIPLLPCLEEVLEDFGPLLEEKHFAVLCSLGGDTVYSDRRGLRFLLGQIVGNSVKYCSAEPTLHIRAFSEDGRYVLSIRDNGKGVRSCDLPYIFEKGFTGDTGEDRKHATGMGLYLAKEIAGELGIDLRAKSRWGEGFEMLLSFPVVDGVENPLAPAIF